MENEEKKPESESFNLEDLKKFLIEVIPIATPLIERAMSGTAEQAKIGYELQKKQLIFEGVFLFLVIGLGAGLIMAFILNDRPDTAEKIVFALLGFLGGRGFGFFRR